MPKTVPRFLRRARTPETRGLTQTPNVSGGLALAQPSTAGILVTPQIALNFTAVYAAINVISRDFASLPPAVRRRTPKGGTAIAWASPAHKLLSREPDPTNPRSSALRFRQALMAHALGWGNGYAEIARDGAGEPVALKLLHPGKTRPKETPSGRLFYELEDGRKLLPENVLHIAGLGFDGVTGYSPVAMARQAIGLGIAAEQFGAALFGNGAVPKGMLKHPKRLSEAAAANLRDSFGRVHGGSENAHRLAVLEEGMEWVNTQINPDDAQFLATRAFQVLEIARMFSIPPHKIGDYSQSHLANVEESNLDYLTTTLAGWVESFEAEANLKLLTEADSHRLFIAHDMTRLLRGNMTARVAYYTGLRNLGAMNADEIRTRENMNPIGPDMGGDKYLIQTSLTTLEKIGEEPLDAAMPGITDGHDDDADDEDEDDDESEERSLIAPGHAKTKGGKKAGRWITHNGHHIFIPSGGETGGFGSGIVAAHHHEPGDLNVSRKRFADETEQHVAKAIGGKWIPGNRPSDAEIDKAGGGKHMIEVKSKSYGNKQSLSVHANALYLKASDGAKNPENTWHTVVVDARHAAEGGRHAGHYSGHELYYKRAAGPYALKDMHKVKDIKELRKLISTPNHLLPAAARGELPKGEALAKMKAQGDVEREYNNARSKERKARIGRAAYRDKSQPSTITSAVSS